MPALEHAFSNAPLLGSPLRNLSFFQTPHHGSKRNLGPTILNKIVGDPLPCGSAAKFTAMISASKNGEPKHPSKRVVNALIRRGARVIATQGVAKWQSALYMPDRGWSAATPLPFYNKVEEDD